MAEGWADGLCYLWEEQYQVAGIGAGRGFWGGACGPLPLQGCTIYPKEGQASYHGGVRRVCIAHLEGELCQGWIGNFTELG